MPDSLPLQMYQPETIRFLQMFAVGGTGKISAHEMQQVKEGLKEVFKLQTEKLHTGERTVLEKKYGLFHPVTLADAMIAKLGFSAEENEKLAEIVSKTYTTDPTTGFFTKQCMPGIVGLAHLYAKETGDTPVCLVEGDFTNMAGCNKHFGKEFAEGKAVTDKLIHEICAIVKNTFKGRAQEVHSMRAGGDETRLVVYGLDERQVNAILKDEVQPKINLLAAKFGVHNIEHTKKQKLPGFGASFACVDLRHLSDPGVIKEKIEVTIGVRKLIDGKMRYGVLNTAGIERYIANYYKNELLEQGFAPADIAARIKEYMPILQKYAAVAQEHWGNLIEQDGQYHALAIHYKTKDPIEFFARHEKASSEQRSNELARIHVPRLPDAKHRIPMWETEVSAKAIEDPEMLRLRKVLKTFGFTKAAEAENGQLVWDRELQRHEFIAPLQERDPHRQRLQRLVIDLMDMFHAPDPAIRCKSTSLMVQDADDFIHKHQGMSVMHIEVMNLTGLNNINSNFADAVLREVGKHIKQALIHYPHADKVPASHMADHVYYEGNGKFKVFLPPDYSHTGAVEKCLQKTIKANILTKSVMGFAEDTYAHLPNPPMKPKNPSDTQAMAQYGREKAAYDTRMEQCAVSMETLKARLEEMRLNNGHITNIASIPHTKRDGDIPVGILCYNIGLIDAETPAAEGLKRIDSDAAKAFEQYNTRQGRMYGA